MMRFTTPAQTNGKNDKTRRTHLPDKANFMYRNYFALTVNVSILVVVNIGVKPFGYFLIIYFIMV